VVLVRGTNMAAMGNYSWDGKVLTRVYKRTRARLPTVGSSQERASIDPRFEHGSAVVAGTGARSIQAHLA